MNYKQLKKIKHIVELYKMVNIPRLNGYEMLMFNLSQDEIDAIQKELDDYMKQMNQPKVPTGSTTIPIVITPTYSGTITVSNGTSAGSWSNEQLDLFSYNPQATAKSGCNHKWKSYIGLNETFVYCEICDEKQK